MNPIQSKSVSKLISVIILVAAIGIALFLLTKDNTLTQLSMIHFSPIFLLLSFIIAYAGNLLGAIPVWRQILKKNGVQQTIRQDICIYCYSSLGSLIPGQIWTIAGRAALYQQLNVSGFIVTASGILEFFVVGIASFIVYSGIAFLKPHISIWAARPWIGLFIILGSMVLIHPRILQHLISMSRKWIKPERELLVGNYRVIDLVRWLLYEMIVIIIGGISIFLLLKSILPVSIELLIPVIATWAAGVAVGTLFFWLPGSPVLRDGTMAIILAMFISPASAILFVGLVRIWLIISLLLLAGMVWLLLDRKFSFKFPH
jgi:hypothetical protein